MGNDYILIRQSRNDPKIIAQVNAAELLREHTIFTE